MENERTEMLERIGEIQRALKPLGYEIVGFDTPLGEPLVIKLGWFTAPSQSREQS